LAQVTCWPLAGAGAPDADLPPEVMGFLQWGQRTVPRTCEGRKKRWDTLLQCSQVKVRKGMIFLQKFIVPAVP
jgi:hypothetical protein